MHESPCGKMHDTHLLGTADDVCTRTLEPPNEKVLVVSV
jgi:hypothetical protein